MLKAFAVAMPEFVNLCGVPAGTITMSPLRKRRFSSPTSAVSSPSTSRTT